METAGAAGADRSGIDSEKTGHPCGQPDSGDEAVSI